MITVLLRMTVKPERRQEFREMAALLTRTTRAADRGCIEYGYYAETNHPNEAILFERWEDQEALDAHVRRLVSLLGPPDEKEPYPPEHHRRRLPKAFLDLFESTEITRYEAVAP